MQGHMLPASHRPTRWQRLQVSLWARLPGWVRRSRYAGLLLFAFFLIKGLLWLLLPLLALWELL